MSALSALSALRTNVHRLARRLGLVALLPALLLTGVLVGAPFAGTSGHPVDQPAPASRTTLSPGR